ncbi:MAG: SIR2 family protein, partial [Anaerolineales bacterium]|nr:SIR2 family protein [Anaerolineales bacterium]
MTQSILSPLISQADFLISSSSIDMLQPYLINHDRSLVFFVGAGASFAGNTGMPRTPSLLYHLLLQALSSSGKFDLQRDTLQATLKEISSHIGFEFTLIDFWQICRQATVLLYESFADLEKICTPNRVHSFIAHWLSTGGTVITTNYDRLIESEWAKTGKSIQSRYREEGTNSFLGWQEDLRQGGCLFKIHGSLDDPDSCLGALEHVGTQLTGNRAQLLEEIIRTRPLCFVGWQGVDPDIPPLLHALVDKRDTSLPTFWIH